MADVMEVVMSNVGRRGRQPVRAILTSGSYGVALFCFNPLVWVTGVE